jgi:hypothetical protein
VLVVFGCTADEPVRQICTGLFLIDEGFTMTGWLREIAGWVLLGIGLAMIAMCYVVFLLSGRVIEGLLFGIAAVFVFRGGLQLLKVAMAAHAASNIRRDLAVSTTPIRQVRPQMAPLQPVGRERTTVVPGPTR